MRNYRATHNKIGVSAKFAEASLNLPQIIDTILLSNLADMINLEPRREDNSDQRIGKEEPDQIYNLGNTSTLSLNFDRAQPQHFAFGLGFALGNVSTTNGDNNSYIHKITPIIGDYDYQRSNPSFTAIMQYGDTVFTRLFSSLFVDQAAATFTKDEWIKLKIDIKGTGAYTDDMNEIIIQDDDAYTLYISPEPFVFGDNNQDLFDSIHRIQVREVGDNQWKEVKINSVEKVVDQVKINIISPYVPLPTGDQTFEYKILYRGVSAFVWPDDIIQETPLRVSNVDLTLGGFWDGSNFQGGLSMNSDINSIEYTINNNLKFDFGFDSSGTATRVLREGRIQTINFSRDLKDFILQQNFMQNQYFGMKILINGAENYQIEMIFPRLAIISAPISIENKIIAEKGDMKVLESDESPSCIIKVQNLIDSYVNNNIVN